MKASKYNIIIPYNGKAIVYNTLWNSFILIRNDNWLLNIVTSEKIDAKEIETIPSVLLDKKILIDESLNEMSYISSMLDNQFHDNSLLDIIVMPTLGCNYKCWYCYENHDGENKRMSSDDIDRLVINIKNKLHNNEATKKVSLGFFGGEPFLYFEEVMKPLLERVKEITTLYDIAFSSSATTNAALITTDSLLYLKNYNFDYMQVTLDGNKARHNKVRFSYPGDNSYDLIVKNIKESISFGIRIVLRLNISEHTKLDVHNILNDFEDVADKSLLTFSINKIWQSSKKVNSLIERIVAEIRNSGYSCRSYYSAPSSIWNVCYADRDNQFVVKPGAHIYKCTARDFTEWRSEGIINDQGEIVWNHQHEERCQTSVFDNNACRECPILPICIGGCRQKQMEHTNKNTCICNMDDKDKIEYARRVFLERLEATTINT